MSEVIAAVPDPQEAVGSDPPPPWTKWIIAALALGCCVLAGLIYIGALRTGGVAGLSAGSGGWWAIYDVASTHRAMSTLLLWAATMLAFGAMLGMIGAVLGRGVNRLGGVLVLVICIWTLGSASLTFMRWREVHDPPKRRAPPPVVVQ